MPIDIFSGGGPLLGILKNIGVILGYAAAGIIILGAGFVIVFFFFRPMLYKYNVMITAERQGNQVHIGADKGRIKKVRAGLFGLVGPVIKTQLDLLKRKVTLPTPAFDKVYPNDMRNSPGTLILTKRGERDYRVSRIKLDNEALQTIEPLDDNLINFVINETKAVRDRNKPENFLSQYGHIIAVGAIIIILFGGLYAAFQYYQAIFDGIGGAASQLAETLEGLNRCRV